MSALDQWFAGGEAAGAHALPVWAAGAIAALLFFLGVIAFVRSTQIGRGSVAWRAALIVVGAGLMWLVVESLGGRDQSTVRRNLDVRSAELTLRAITPGSPLACLEALSNATVEEACERVLFANAETVASAVAYVDARLALLADGLDLANRDQAYAASIERARRALEADRFGLVAHVLATRGCTPEKCPALRLLRDPRRVTANLRDRTFDASVVLHAPSWRSDAPAAVAVAPPPSAPTLAAVPTPVAPSTTGAAPTGRFEFPSSASIPAISIMNAEPALPAGEGADAPPAQAAAPAARPAQRRAPREASQATQPQAAQPAQAQASHAAPSVPLPLAPPGTIANPR